MFEPSPTLAVSSYPRAALSVPNRRVASRMSWTCAKLADLLLPVFQALPRPGAGGGAQSRSRAIDSLEICRNLLLDVTELI